MVVLRVHLKRSLDSAGARRIKGEVGTNREHEPRRYCDAGFSLLELLIVLVLLSLSSLLILPSIDKALREYELRLSVLGLAATARGLRSRAIASGASQRLSVDPAENRYGSAGAATVLPSQTRITGIAGGEPIGGGERQYLFFPNGSILGGEIELAGATGSAYVIRLEPLSGRVVV